MCLFYYPKALNTCPALLLGINGVPQNLFDIGENNLIY